jgi:hypothetical protein
VVIERNGRRVLVQCLVMVPEEGAGGEVDMGAMDAGGCKGEAGKPLKAWPLKECPNNS